MLPEQPDSSSSSNSSGDGSEISSTSLPTTSTSSATTLLLSSPGMFAAVLQQLRAELAVERRMREALEARQRELAVHLYHLVDEQIRGVKAIKLLVQSVRDGREDRAGEIITVMKRMKAAWGKKARTSKRARKNG